MTTHFEGATPDGGPPDFDGPSVARVASRVELDTIDLLSLSLAPSDGDRSEDEDAANDGGWGIGAEWRFDGSEGDDGVARLEARFAFTWTRGGEVADYVVYAEFRLQYTVARDEELTADDLSQFVHWNAVFNAWPYWRELLTNITMRTEIGPIVAPVFKMPASRAADGTSD